MREDWKCVRRVWVVCVREIRVVRSLGGAIMRGVLGLW